MTVKAAGKILTFQQIHKTKLVKNELKLARENPFVWLLGNLTIH